MKKIPFFSCMPTRLAAVCLLSSLLGSLLLSACQSPKTNPNADPHSALRSLPLTPAPQAVTFTEGSCTQWEKPESRLLPDSLGTATFPTQESYRLTVAPQGVKIEAAGAAGLYYGQVSLQQLKEGYGTEKGLPCMVITDSPRYSWRGMHLDVSRHFFPKEFILKQLDAMAYYKLNRFHWHLTDGPGWRLEIPQYPELTRKAAWRMIPLWKDWWASPRHYVQEGTPGAYGGYYTAQDVREVLAYAAARHITVVPEIEMPGHSEEVLAVYPHLGCPGRPYESSEFCIGNEATFTFLENVLSYVIDLFPSEFIHIGGDEAAKDHWRNCPKCQARMKAEGLKSEEELQSYLIHRIDRFIVSKGRRLMGWDEIMEGGLSPNATVMSWRGEEGGIKAAELGHDVVMTPGAYCYLDGFQANPATEKEATGHYLPLEKVYSYNPACKTLGVQGNVWCEFIPTEAHVEHMAWPRMIAMAEVGWTAPERKDWEDFKTRVNGQVARLQGLGYHPYALNPEIEVRQRGVAPKPEAAPNCIEVALVTELSPVEIRYTTDGTEPTTDSPLYTTPLRTRDSLKLQMRLFRNGQALGRVQGHEAYMHKGVGKRVTYLSPYYPTYTAGGPDALADGSLGGYSYNDHLWQGFCPRDLDVIIDLGSPTPVQKVYARFIQNPWPGVYFPSEVEVYGSEDGKLFTSLGKETTDPEVLKQKGIQYKHYGWTAQDGPQTVRMLRFTARQTRREFIFTDEIVVL